MNYKKLLYVLLALSCHKPVLNQSLTKLVIVHNNDIHGKFYETDGLGGECTDSERERDICYGGFAKIKSILDEYRANSLPGEAVLYLDAGDLFEKLIWFIYLKTDLASKLMNLLKPDAIALGHREFEFLPETLSKYITSLETNVLAANIDTSQETSYKLNIKKSVVLTKFDKKIGIIGYISPTSVDHGLIGDLKISEEIPAIQIETQRLKNIENVDYIIALGHSGASMDQRIAKQVDGLDLVVGGHSHHLFLNGHITFWEVVEAPYPLLVPQKSGKNVAVVQAYCNSKYLGVLTVLFSEGKNQFDRYNNPKLLYHTGRTPNQEIIDIMDNFRPQIRKLFVEIIGQAETDLQGGPEICRNEECTFGNLIADALVTYASSNTTKNKEDILVSIYPGRCILHTISAGNITKADLLNALPFENSVIVLTLTGSDLFHCMEEMFSVEKTFPQVSGLFVVVDKSKPPYSRVDSIDVRRDLSRSSSYDPLILDKDYRIITPRFLAEGGDGGTILKNKGRYRETLHLNDTAIVQWYIKKQSVVKAKVEERVKILNAGVIWLSNSTFVVSILYICSIFRNNN